MEKATGFQKQKSSGLEVKELSNEDQELMITQLPRVKNWNGKYLCQYQGFWWPSMFLPGVISFQKNFLAYDSDIILASFPKSGITWLKAIIFAIVNRSRYALHQSPIFTTFPHELVPFIDINIYLKNDSPILDDFPAPRIFSVHSPYTSLPKSILNSNCRVVYICRNPLDQFTSMWNFQPASKGHTTEGSLFNDAFEMYCRGVSGFGPSWEHVLGYWKASIEEPHKILFLKYEDLKGDITFYIKTLANFVGLPFSEEEESQGVIEEISKICSLDHLKNLEANKIGKDVFGLVEKSSFFRKGNVGDWKNCLPPSKAEYLNKLTQEKLFGSGLTF